MTWQKHAAKSERKLFPEGRVATVVWGAIAREVSLPEEGGQVLDFVAHLFRRPGMW
jgi:hypothetical protein